MDHVAGRQREAWRDHCLAGRTAHTGRDLRQRTAGLQQGRTGRAMDGAIHATAAQQAGVGGVHDGVQRQRGDIGNGYAQDHGLSKVGHVCLRNKAGPE
jgi:hypothetical protein